MDARAAIHGPGHTAACFEPLPLRASLEVERASLGVGSRQITTFFSDIANFTTICETMNPEELLNLLTEYFDSMSPLVINSGGSVLDYIGDAKVLPCSCARGRREMGCVKLRSAASLRCPGMISGLVLESPLRPPGCVLCALTWRAE